MSRNAVSTVTGKTIRPTRRRFLGETLAAAAACALVERRAAAAESPAPKTQLWIGAASVDITPNKAVALWGQFGLRLSTKPDTPLTANVVALQSADARTTFVSLDLLQLPEVFVQAIRDAVAKTSPLPPPW